MVGFIKAREVHMADVGPYSNYRLTARLELANHPGMFARVATTLAEEGANLGAVDIVSATPTIIVRDVTFDVQDEGHGDRVITALNSIEDLKVVSVSDRIFLLHLRGKIGVESKLPITTRNILSMVYTPGVGRVSQAIAKDPAKAYAFTTKCNSVAIVTDGSAVLGLGNLGPYAALPVMEGKAMLFKELADIDAWPICLNTQEPEDIVRMVQGIAPGFGGINLEDISAPRCFEIERRLKDVLDIPVMHDDQHGTAVVLLAASQCADGDEEADRGCPDRRQWPGRGGSDLLQNFVSGRRVAYSGLKSARHGVVGGRGPAPRRTRKLRGVHRLRTADRIVARCAEGRRCLYRPLRGQCADTRRFGTDGAGSHCVCHGESRSGNFTQSGPGSLQNFCDRSIGSSQSDQQCLGLPRIISRRPRRSGEGD